MRALLRYISTRTWKRYLEWYLRKPRRFSFKGMTLIIEPGVFHPGFFYSTRFLLGHIAGLDLQDKKVLELGCGSGLIALYAAGQNARVTASDISQTAVGALGINAASCKRSLSIVHSDLFAGLPRQEFDLIIVNPPYYKGVPASEAEYAWYCGPDLAYFRRLFAEAGSYMHAGSSIVMVLSEACDIAGIRTLAEAAGMRMEEVSAKQFLLEKNFIYHLKVV